MKGGYDGRMHSLVLGHVLALIHGQAASATAESVALGPEFAAVAGFAVQLVLVLGAICRVEQLAAQTCNHSIAVSLFFLLYLSRNYFIKCTKKFNFTKFLSNF